MFLDISIEIYLLYLDIQLDIPDRGSLNIMKICN